MKIHICSDDKAFTIPVPTGLVVWGASQNREFKDALKKVPRKILKDAKKQLQGEPLLEVISGDGDGVTIFL